MTSKQKAILAYEIMDAAVNRIRANRECDIVPRELKDLSDDDMLRQVSRWLVKLPGNIWHTDLPASR